jgi:hypothetical protein
MTVGDLIMHRTTGFIAIIIHMPGRRDILNVMTQEGPGWWRASRCDVVS